jgi:dethiobiotin synthetase
VSYFVTGTDTGVGKTLVSCALLHAIAAQDRRVAGFKPVAAGCDENEQNEDALALCAASSVSLACEQINPYCFAPAIAPHLAADFSGMRIELSYILDAYRELAAQADEIVVEGAGGFLVPLNERQDSADLAQQLNLPVILVVGMRLGCLNHALLTMRAIAGSGLKCAGWVANVVEQGMPALQQNIDTLRERIDAPLLGVVPYMEKPDAHVLAELLDVGLLNKGEDDGRIA